MLEWHVLEFTNKQNLEHWLPKYSGNAIVQEGLQGICKKIEQRLIDFQKAK